MKKITLQNKKDLEKYLKQLIRTTFYKDDKGNILDLDYKWIKIIVC